MVKNKLVDLIVPIISLIASAVAIILIFNFGVKILKDSGDNLKKERQKIEAEYEELHEDNFDEETGKKILTDRFLDKEYRSYYLGKKASNKSFVAIVTLMIFGFMAIYLISGIVMMIIDLARGRKAKIASVIVSIVLIPCIIVGMHYFNKLIDRKLPPNPDNATYQAYPYNVIAVQEHKEVRHHDDEPDETITTYKLLYEVDGQRKSRDASGRIHTDFKKPGMYYLIQVEGDGKLVDFTIYPCEEYEVQK